jgi:molybdopterin synthase catalytic subunit
MDMQKLIRRIKEHPEYDKVGMILCHQGVVRSTSRDGQKVSGLRVSVDHAKLKQVVDTYKQKEGIVEVLVEIAEEKDLALGDTVMLLIVAGDIRDRVIPVLNDALNALKKTVTHKTEFFV